MAQLLIREIPEALVLALQEQAAAKGRRAEAKRLEAFFEAAFLTAAGGLWRSRQHVRQGLLKD